MTTLCRFSLLASLFVLPALAPSLASAADISLDNVALPTGEKSKITFKHIEIVDTNLTQEEAAKLFSGAATNDEAAALIGKLKAARISIPEATATSDKPGAIVFHDFKAEGIDQGAVAHLALGGAEADLPVETGGKLVFKSQAVTVDGVQIQHLADAIRTREAKNAALRVAHVAWSGFDLSIPDKDTPATADGGNLIRLRLNSATADQSFDGDSPLKSSFALSGLSLSLPKSSQGGAMLTALGYDKIDASLKIDGTYDPAMQTFSLDNYRIEAVNIGSFGLRGRVSGLDKAAFGGDAKAKSAAMEAAALQSLELRIVNSGAFDKAVAIAALSGSKTPVAVKTEWSALVAQGPLMMPDIPAAATISQGLLNFIANGKSLTLSLNAKAPAPKFAEMAGLEAPQQALGRFDVTAVAEGTAPALAVLATPTPPAPDAQAPAETRKLTGLAAWSALVGNTITGKDSEGSPLSEFYAADGAVKQLDDDEVATGKWAVRGDKACFIFAGEKEETCYTVEVAGNVATFFDVDGDGKRYKILKGNAKNL
ncbi:hypothetical protein QM467_10825 [Rhodoblastus sp. 17X3]|uniref:hypothetical protein n=1 Tax=Rhodoblastus sp. 17X3 TaxID=3047026 RepID=UPI0024B6E4C4|nr:hypothetical protein [Rhodoblastus sp. 17X3]MDI9848549.1 hypothetical protein [Rhodoblastus sp. 17X3]